MTVNPVSKLDRYPIQKPENLFTKFANGKKSSLLSTSATPTNRSPRILSPTSTLLSTITKVQYTRFFCISLPTGIFQHMIESIPQRINGVVVYLDDILVTGSMEEAHLKALEEVLRRLKQDGLRVKQSKCTFMQPSVCYLGHNIYTEGLHRLDDHPRCIYSYLCL